MVVSSSGDPASPARFSLSISQVSKVFGSTEALAGMTLTVDEGEIVALIGPSGCGKSTVLRLIAGLDRPTAGNIFVGSKPVTGPSAERGLMFQRHSLFPWLTVRKNIEAGLVARGVLHDHRQESEKYLQLMGLEGFANAYPSQLSGGMAQRVALARAIINHPKVLLLDEPLGALDQFTRMKMQDEVLRIWEISNTTMVLVTHDIDEAIYMSDRIAIMTARPGRIDRIIDVSLDRPRLRNSDGFLKLRSELLDVLHFAGRSDQSDLPEET